jgi:hypothetical protein
MEKSGENANNSLQMSGSPLDIFKSPSGDKREWRRFNIELTILVEPVTEDDDPMPKSARPRQSTALVTDISLNGLYFISAVVYPINSLVDIQLTLGTQRFELRCLVCRAEDKELPGRTAHGSGVKFVRTDNVKVAIPAIANYILKKNASGTPLTTKEEPLPAAEETKQLAA